MSKALKTAVIDCQEVHRYQRLPGECSLAGMLTFMGGRVGVDVPRGHIIRSRTEGCIVDFAEAVSNSAVDVLASNQDDGWRLCFDERKGIYVSCEVPHTAEFVATGLHGKATSDECVSASELYLHQNLDAVAEDLAVKVLGQVDEGANSARCVIEVRGVQPLVASVRDLGVSPVPIRR